MLIGISLILALIILVFDLSMPLGVAAGAPYVVLVLAGYFASWRYYIYLMAGIASLLTIIGYYASPAYEVTWVVLTNRGLTLGAIWVTAVIVAYIQKKEAKFRTAIDSASDGIIGINSLGVIESFNKGAETIFGYSAGEMTGENVSMLMPSPHHERHDDYILRYLKTSEAHILGKTRVLNAQRKDGTIFPMELTVSESHYMGKPTFTGIIRDISDRVQAAEQLNKLSSAIEQSPVSIIITDLSGNIEYVNPKFTQVSGYAYDEVIGKNPRMLKSGETLPEEYKKLWKTIAAGGQWRGIFHNLKKNGELYWEAATISPIRNHNGEITHFLAVKEDITEQLERENQLVHALKVEATGRLTSGIAHDFNNLLTIITGNLQLLAGDLGRKGNAETNAILADAISACADSKKLLKRLLELSRRESPPRHDGIDINEFVLDMARFLDRILGEDIRVKTRLANDAGAIAADHDQLESTMLNLAANSRDAMPEGGTFTIETARINVVPGSNAGIGKLKPGDYIALTISDTGIGMSREVLQHACEPFFTTKASGEGSGLGLNLVQDFINHAGGCLDITSVPGSGTSITLFFHEAVRETSKRGTGNRAARMPAGTETILVVEDRDRVRRFAVRGLKSLGYRVWEAADADVAMEILRKDVPVDLLFTDIVIPGELDGRELAEWATGIRPGLKAALTTGQPPGNRNEIPGAKFALLMKPYSFEHLAVFVRAQLDKDK